MRLRGARPSFELGPVALFECAPVLGRGTVSTRTGQAGIHGSPRRRRARSVLLGIGAGRRRRRGVPVSRCLRRHPTADRPKPRDSGLAALCLVELQFLAMQAGQRGTLFPLRRLDARGHDEMRLTCALLFVEPGDRRGAFGGNALALRRHRCGRRSIQRLGRQADQAHHGTQLPRHVSAVSTSRRASARYSTDCISRSRDTVRGNSCASGPSVYSPSGSTAADAISLTRRS